MARTKKTTTQHLPTVPNQAPNLPKRSHSINSKAPSLISQSSLSRKSSKNSKHKKYLANTSTQTDLHDPTTLEY